MLPAERKAPSGPPSQVPTARGSGLPPARHRMGRPVGTCLRVPPAPAPACAPAATPCPPPCLAGPAAAPCRPARWRSPARASRRGARRMSGRTRRLTVSSAPRCGTCWVGSPASLPCVGRPPPFCAAPARGARSLLERGLMQRLIEAWRRRRRPAAAFPSTADPWAPSTPQGDRPPLPPALVQGLLMDAMTSTPRALPAPTAEVGSTAPQVCVLRKGASRGCPLHGVRGAGEGG